MNAVETTLFREHCGKLRMFCRFDDGLPAAPFRYGLRHTAFDEIRKRYDLPNCSQGDELDISFGLLRWVSRHVYHNGNEDRCQDNALSVLEYAFDTQNGVSCFHQSVVLCECLLGYGVYARILHMMPLNPYDFDSHVVVMAYVPSLAKWIMLDPTHCCYCMNEVGDVLSPMEIRERLSLMKALICSGELSYNGTSIDANDGAEARAMYYAKNMFYFYTTMITTSGSEFFPDNRQVPIDQRNYYLAPAGFDPVEHERAKVQYCMAHSQDDESWKEFLAFIKATEDRRQTVSIEAFFGGPDWAATRT